MRLTKHGRATLPIEDYSAALRKAVQWMGERYLLAVPVKARLSDAIDSGFFRQQRPWNQNIRRRID